MHAPGWIAGELQRWQDEGIITADQVERIRALYAQRRGAPSYTESGPAPSPDAGEPRSKLVVLLSIVGAVLVAAGVVLFFAHNWTDFPRWVKLLLIGVALLGTFFAADQLIFSERWRSPRVGRALLVTGGALFGAAIFLIGQIYNINAHWPNGLLAWWLGVLPLVYIFDSGALMWLVLLLAQSWFCSEFLQFTSYHASLGLILLVALLIWTLGDAHRRFAPRASGPMQGFALLEGLTALFASTFGYAIGHSQQPYAETHVGWILLPLAVVALLIWNLVTAPELRKMPIYPAAIVGLTCVAGFWLNVVVHATAWARVAFNAVLILTLAGVLLFGIRSGRSWMVNAASVFIAMEAFARYIDAFWGYLTRSAAFLITGLILLGGGWILERQRRSWLGRARVRGVSV